MCMRMLMLMWIYYVCGYVVVEVLCVCVCLCLGGSLSMIVLWVFVNFFVPYSAGPPEIPFFGL